MNAAKVELEEGWTQKERKRQNKARIQREGGGGGSLFQLS